MYLKPAFDVERCTVCASLFCACGLRLSVAFGVLFSV